MIVGSAVAGILIASRARGILDTIIIFNYPYMGSMLVPLLGGVLFPKATAKGAIAAMFVGGAIGVVSFLAGVPGRIHGLFNVDLGLLLAYTASAVVFVVVSLYTHPATKGGLNGERLGARPWSGPTLSNGTRPPRVSADVLVLGGGIAGCWAAIGAAKRGAKVVLVEKGATIASGAGGSGCDHWESAATNPCSRVTPEELTDALVRSHGGYCNGISHYIECREG